MVTCSDETRHNLDNALEDVYVTFSEVEVRKNVCVLVVLVLGHAWMMMVLVVVLVLGHAWMMMLVVVLVLDDDGAGGGVSVG